MAHKNVDYKPEDIQFPNQKIVQSELVHEMQSSYIEYAMSVIVGRALPDVRDGLKPVHRRILYAMYEDGLTSDKAFKKSATCVGDVLGRYHPHGDASVYDALVRLAQDFSMRYMLVDGHGNFGSVDGDPPAAYRYTEARLSKISNEMLRDIRKDTVDWDPNFDESRKEPRVLPSRFPNLLVNGSSGIAVGMASQICGFNLAEVCDTTIALLKNPDHDIASTLLAPDFPTGGIVINKDELEDIYETGTGKIKLRGKVELQKGKSGKINLLIVHIAFAAAPVTFCTFCCCEKVSLDQFLQINDGDAQLGGPVTGGGVADLRGDDGRLGTLAAEAVPEDGQLVQGLRLDVAGLAA